MPSFMNKALAYLGLKDLDEDEYEYDDYEDYGEDAAPVAAPPLVGRTVYPRHEEEQPEQRSFGGTIRPLQSPAHAPTQQGQPQVKEDSNSRPSAVRPLTGPRQTAAKVHIVAPEHFVEAQEIGDLIKQGNPVIVNLQLSDNELGRRMIDFCSGLTYALGGSMERVADHVFLLTPSNVEVTAEERSRLQERGLFQQ
jgi:cell division inhibitor SepF